MTHIDEGTIHAWLDGALGAMQSREVEAHVAQCSVCAAAVAEARGLVAGASRILTALDDVPAGVTPTWAPMPRRQWRAAPWVTGIAAALVLAIGVRTWNSGEVARETALPKDMSAAAPVVSPSPDSALAPPSVLPTASPQRLRANEQRAVVATSQPRRAPSPETKQLSEEIGERRSVARMDVASGAAAGAPAAPPAAVSAPAKAEAEAAGVRPQPSAKLDFRADIAEHAQMMRRKAVDSSDVEKLVGCYRIEPPSGFARQLAGAGAVARAAAGRAAEPTARDYVVAPRVTGILRLDSVQKPMGYIVRAEPSDSTIGWWSRVGEDSARVDLLSGTWFSVLAKNRISCPER